MTKASSHRAAGGEGGGKARGRGGFGGWGGGGGEVLGLHMALHRCTDTSTGGSVESATWWQNCLAQGLAQDPYAHGMRLISCCTIRLLYELVKSCSAHISSHCLQVCGVAKHLFQTDSWSTCA